MSYSLRGKECIAKHQVVVVRQPRALGGRPQRAMHMSMGKAQEWHVTLPACIIAEVHKDFTNNDVGAVLDAGVVMMVDCEVWGVRAAKGSCQDVLEFRAVRRNRR